MSGYGIPKIARADANEPEIVAALELVSDYVWRIRWPADLLVLFRGRFIVLEVKNPNGRNRLTISQRILKRLAETKGAPFAVVRNPQEALDALDEFGPDDGCGELGY